MKHNLSKLSVGIFSVLAFGWVATVVSAYTLSGGHPPWAYFIGGADVLLSFVMAPVGAGMALVVMRRARRAGTSTPSLIVASLWMNTLLLMWAIFLWFYFMWEASRR